MYGCRRRKRKCFFLSAKSYKIYFYKNAKVLDTGRKFIVNIKFNKVCIFNVIYLDILGRKQKKVEGKNIKGRILGEDSQIQKF